VASFISSIDEAMKTLIFNKFKDRYIKMNGKYPTTTFKESGKLFKGILIKFIKAFLNLDIFFLIIIF
jgi:hypothetical protein